MPHAPRDPDGRGASGRNGAVAAATPEASRTGIEILRMGGNAVDAAVAAGFANGVLEPHANGLGGGGFMIIRMAGMAEAAVIDFRGTAPGSATPTLFQGAGRAATVGGLAAIVPAETAGLLLALERFGSGRISRARILQPAIHWAGTGFPVSANLSRYIREASGKLRRFPASAALYLPGGSALEPGARLANPDLAETLARIAAEGRDAFYRGGIAGRIVDEVQRTGGRLTLADLAAYQPRLRRPVTGSYRGHTLMSVPPASAGGTLLIELLQILETFDLVRSGAGAAHLWIEALRLVGADRARHLGDSGFNAVPLARLTSKAYARSQAAKIRPGRCLPGPGDPWRHPSGSTTHLSVLDRTGNMVALTKTINDFFGCGVTVPGTGILLNDDMDDFSLSPDSPNAIAPGKRPLSSMSPTLVLDPAGRPWMTLGTPGGPRIVATTAQIIANCVDFGMPIGAAINAPRLFLGEAGDLEAEGRLPAAVCAEMRRLGHRVTLREDWDLYFGGAQAAVYDHARGIITGAADPRRDGQAAAF